MSGTGAKGACTGVLLLAYWGRSAAPSILSLGQSLHLPNPPVKEDVWVSALSLGIPCLVDSAVTDQHVP